MRTCLLTPLIVLIVLSLMLAMFAALWVVPVVLAVWALGWWALSTINARRGRIRPHGYDRED